MAKVPKYAHHKPSNRAYVLVSGRRIYLGKHGSPSSLEAYHRIVGRIAAGEQPTEPPKPG